MKKKILIAGLATLFALSVAACSYDAVTSGNSTDSVTSSTAAVKLNDTSSKTSTDSSVTENVSYDTNDLFTERDLEQTADTSEAQTITVTDNKDIEITEEGIYVITGTASEVTIKVNAGDEDKVQLVLDGVSITNKDFPCIYVVNADKVFVTTAEGMTNKLSVTGEFTSDGGTNTDAVIFSKDDIVLNGEGTLEITSSKNAISGKDDLKITGGSYVISCVKSAVEANDSILIADGNITVTTCNDGLHAENDDDDTLGYIYISGGTISINSEDDGIHATSYMTIDGGDITITASEGLEGTVITINDGTLNITASDDGINAARKSSSYQPSLTVNGGEITIDMGAGDTDAIDSNGDLYINGGTFNITAQSPFDYDGNCEYTGGTLIVNGSETNTITNQMMGGGMGPGSGGMDPGQGGMGGHGGRGGF